MRDVTSQLRRRRVRLIKAIEERSAQQFRSAASALTIASETESARLDFDLIRQKLLVECQAKSGVSLRVEHAGASSMNVAMDRPCLLIGSDLACDLRLEHDDVKPQHCYLQWIEGHLFCCDVGVRTSFPSGPDSQSNGRWIDRQPFSVGPFQLTLVRHENSRTSHSQTEVPADVFARPDFSPLDRSPRLANEYPLLALQFEGVEQHDNVWPVNRMLTLIGRGPQCKLRLNHKSMAYVQACLLRTSKDCWLIDLAKDGTTRVNDRMASIAPVDVGDVLQLGVFRVEVVTTAVQSVPPAIANPSEKKTSSSKSEARLNEATGSVAQLLKLQQDQIEALKKQLDELKQVSTHPRDN